MMIDWMEHSCQPLNETQFTRRGTVHIHTDVVNEKRPTWLVTLKVGVILIVVPVCFALVVQRVPLPTLQAVALTGGILLLYVGIAYFIRPEANTDNMGWLGGARDDPFQYNDDINRALFKANCLLAPGRFVAESFVELLTICHVIPEVTSEQAAQQQAREAETQRLAREQEIKARVAARQAERQYGGTVTLSSAQYLSSDHSGVE